MHTPENDQIHGHSVMELMINSGNTFTKETLKAAILAQFGPDARFYTCSADSMDAQEIIDHLEGKGKFDFAEDGFQTRRDKICNH